MPIGLGSLKSKVDKLDVYKLVPVTTDLKKLSAAVDNEVVIKDVYKELVKTLKAIDTSGLVKNTDHDDKINEIKSVIRSINGLANTAVLNDVKSKIPGISKQNRL